MNCSSQVKLFSQNPWVEVRIFCQSHLRLLFRWVAKQVDLHGLLKIRFLIFPTETLPMQPFLLPKAKEVSRFLLWEQQRTTFLRFILTIWWKFQRKKRLMASFWKSGSRTGSKHTTWRTQFYLILCSFTESQWETLCLNLCLHIRYKYSTIQLMMLRRRQRSPTTIHKSFMS